MLYVVGLYVYIFSCYTYVYADVHRTSNGINRKCKIVAIITKRNKQNELLLHRLYIPNSVDVLAHSSYL